MLLKTYQIYRTETGNFLGVQKYINLDRIIQQQTAFQLFCPTRGITHVQPPSI